MTWNRKRNILIGLMLVYAVFVVLGVVLWMIPGQEKVQGVQEKAQQNVVLEALKKESVDLIDELIELSG